LGVFGRAADKRGREGGGFNGFWVLRAGRGASKKNAPGGT